MKRIFSAILAILMLLPLAACGGGESLNTDGTAPVEPTPVTTTDGGEITLPDGFSVGFGRSDMTPTKLPIYTFQGKQGYRVAERLYVTSVAVSDGENVVLFVSVDSRGISNTMASIGRKRIANTFHIPEENVILTATHTHAGVDLARETDVAVSSWFSAFYSKHLPEAVEASLLDLAPATMTHGQSTVEACYNRRYKMSDGTWLSNRYADEGTYAVGSESEVDNVMNLLYFERAGKKPVAFLNFQCHPSTASWETISSDWIDPLRKNVEEVYGALFSYYQGAAGVLMHKTILPDALSLTETDAVGNHFSKAFDAAYQARVPAETGAIRVKTASTVGQFMEVTEEEFAELAAYNAAPEEEKTKILSWFVANARQKIKKYNAKGVTEVAIPHTAVSFGDVGIVTAGYELFHETGLFVKENSPFKITLTFGYTNENLGYIPPKESFPHGEYEVESCIFVEGTAEACGETMLSLLRQVAAL